jgi:hypothetical protein
MKTSPRHKDRQGDTETELKPYRAFFTLEDFTPELHLTSADEARKILDILWISNNLGHFELETDAERLGR